MIFNESFFPTPVDVVYKMVSPIKDLRNRTILEPSAGKGDILDAICKSWTWGTDVKPTNIYAIEPEPELRTILIDKGYQVIDTDFLNFECQYVFDLILMNPPFANGDEHLLKAWDVLAYGDIVCLLNAETVDNLCTERRKLLSRIIEDHGTIENLGPCFITAERKTNVDVVMVRLHKEKKESRFNFTFDPEDDASQENIDFGEAASSCCDIAVLDRIGTEIHAYNKSKDAMIEFIRAYEKLKFYSEPFFSYSSVLDDRILKSISGSPEQRYNNFVKQIKSTAWRNLMSQMNMEKYMTADVQRRFSEFCEQQGSYDLTRKNISDMILFIFDNRITILSQAVEDVFDIFTKYHKENRMHVEGWVTNEQFKANRKVILPTYDRLYSFTYDASRQEYKDIDKAMCFLAGKNYDEVTTIQTVVSNIKIGDSSLHQSTFFSIRCYKKGTIHLTFLDAALWEKFNYEACCKKMWIGK